MPSDAVLKVHQAVAQALYANGAHVMFGLMGDANMFMSDHFIQKCGGQFVSAANEAGAICMATGYALVSGKPGICSVTYGPALTNAITGIVEAVRGTTSIVLITGSTAVEVREHPQALDNAEFARVAGAGYEVVRSTRTVAADVARALRRAQVERRPIILDIPFDIEWLDAVDFAVEKVRIPENRALTSTSEDLDNAIGMIAAARRPVVLAGRGATSPEARAAIIRLARRIEAPLATTLKGKDLFRGEAFNLGVFGTLSTATAAETIVESDCVIAFGASLSMYTMSLGAFRKNKRFIQINLEPEEIGKNISPDAGLVGHPAEVADLIVHWLDEAEIQASGACSEKLQARIDAEGLPEKPLDLGAGRVNLLEAVRRLEQQLPADRIFVVDSGRFAPAVWKYIHVEHPRLFVFTSNFASIGLALSHGIGAASAEPGRPVVVAVGDGGFMNGGLAEFNSAVRANADLIVVVINDGCYGAEQMKFAARGMDDSSVLFQWPDFVPVAQALGGEGVTLRCEADWPAVAEAIEKRTRPLLIDVRLDPRQVEWEG